MMPIEPDHVSHDDLIGSGPERPGAATGRAAGEAKRQAEQVLLKELRPIYARRWRRALLSRLHNVGIATLEDVRAEAELPDSIEEYQWGFGYVTRPLEKAGIIRMVGHTVAQSARGRDQPLRIWGCFWHAMRDLESVETSSSGRRNTITKVWCLRDRREANAWLWSHPLLSEERDG
jgi:hypothetical protein